VVDPRAHHELRVDCGHEVVAALVDELRDPLESAVHIQAIDSHT